LKTNPQLRQFLEKNAEETETFQKAYSAALQNGQQLMRSTVAALAPQLNQIALEHWPAAIAQIAQADPVRGELIVNTLKNWDAIQQQESVQKYYHEQVSQQNNAAQTKAADAAFEKAIGDKAKIKEAGELLPSYLEGIGVDPKAMARMVSDPAYNTVALRQILFDAVQFNKIKTAPKPRATPATVPVTRPGTAAHRPAGDNSTSIRALERQLESATGHKAARLGAKLLAAKRAS
jgi:hypothetical protein